MGCLHLEFSHLIRLLLALFVGCIFLNIAAAAASLCHPDDQAVLLKLKESWTTDPSIFGDCDPKMKSWDGSSECCSWNGVSCDEFSGHVVGLDLRASCIIGNIYPDSSLFSLQHIQKLNLASNNFNFSSISVEFGQLTSLTHLDLSSSMFTGYVPDAISLLTELVSLDLSVSAHIELSIKRQSLISLFRNLTKLRELVLFGVYLSGASPEDFMNLTSSLVSLNLIGCSLYGEFSESVFHLPNLESLLLSGNRGLKGSIPEFSNRTSALKMLDLSGTKFSGKLPFSIGHLKSLEVIDLSESNFSGTIPASIGNLTYLSLLDLSSNSFSGEVPSSLSHLHHLTYMSLWDNAFHGCLPDVFGNLSNLEHFDFTNKHSVRQSGFRAICQLPLSIFNLPKLSYFKCPDCRLLGSIPNQIVGLSNLIYLDLSQNFLNRTIPPWLFSLMSLEFLNLQDNRLSGQVQIPSPISNSSGVFDLTTYPTLQNLSILDLSNNRHLNYYLPSLRLLRLSSCNISEFPNFLKGSTSLQQLDLSKNRIQGKLPKWMTNQIPPWESLQLFDIHSNSIEGTLPVPSPNIEFFSVSDNKFTGEIPSLFCNASILQNLDPSKNSLGGTIPHCLGNVSTDLTMINLGSNTLHGTIPEILSACDRLVYINLNGNLLEGLVPRSLTNCQSLEALDLGNNLINDTFPMWLSTLPKLKVLVLHQNRFHGPLNNGKTKSSFPSLQIVDISNNGFNGRLSFDYFPKLNSMIDIDELDPYYMGGNCYSYSFRYSITLNLKGSQLTLEKIFDAFTTVDFSSNKFSGNVPANIGMLVALKGLNLSYNHLNGDIPGRIGNLTSLEWLDLSSNNLTGKIPVQLKKLTSLTKLNLSYNQLEGHIPKGPQLVTFASSSYEGNPRLCGFPLSRKCMQNQENSPPHLTSSWDDIYGFNRRTISIGYAFGTVFGLFMGYLVISKGRLKWIAWIAERVHHKR